MGENARFESDREKFFELFKRATGNEPFPYQWRLASADPLPVLLDVPTGAGKTAAAVLGWVWRRRLAGKEVRARTSRRLVYCLPMRVLVEQTYDNTCNWLRALDFLADNPGDDRPALDGGWRIPVSLIMGGETADDWDRYPEREAILIGTQDMLLSRALNRGYGMSRYRWPMHFALLNNDCLWVLDEVQLMGSGLPTTAQLQAFRAGGKASLGTYGPTHSLWMSATLKTEALETVDFRDHLHTLIGNAIRLDGQDRKNGVLAKRLDAKKPLSRARVSLNKENAKSYARDLAQEVTEHHLPGTLTLVVVNRVKRAQEIFQALQATVNKQACGESPVPELILIHARFRPAERQDRQHRLQEVDRQPPAGGCIVVTTQAIEAGVDISARLLVTELAPWTSLVQRFGRCNRRGEWDGQTAVAQVLWVDIAGDDKNLVLPYDAADLGWARTALGRLTDAGPQVLGEIQDPSMLPLRHVLRRRDLLDLFDTTPDLAGNDLDVSPYIRDAKDNDVQVYWREWEGDVPPEQVRQPHRFELCAVSLQGIRGFLKDHVAYRWDSLDGRWILVTRGAPIWPGMTLLVHARQGGYDPERGWTGESGYVIPVFFHQGEDRATDDMMDDDPVTFVSRFVHLTEHSQDVVREMEQLLTSFHDLPGIPVDELISAARWHDAGKAHAAFQNALLKGIEEEERLRSGGPWAKSGTRRGRLRYGVCDGEGRFQPRPHFRHELASALLLLQNAAPNLVCYLVGAHHGKVRLSIRSLPDEASPPGGGRFARGVWEGDVLPPIRLAPGAETSQTTLRLGVMELGEGADGPSWLERSLFLREQYGPFRLAWLETLVRVADWRGTMARSGVERKEGTEGA